MLDLETPPSWFVGWFEEEGELDYRDWVGESFMFGIVLAYTDMVPSFDFFTHKSTPEVVAAIRQILTPPPPAPPVPTVVGIKCKPKLCRRVYHRPECRIVRLKLARFHPLEAGEIADRRGCKVCRPETT